MGESKKGFDLASTANVAEREDTGIVIELRDESGAPLTYEGQREGEACMLPVTVRVAGTYSSLYRRTMDLQRDRMLKQRRATLTSEQLARQTLELTASCILDWDGFTNGEAPFHCTSENKIMLLQRAPWIREQIEEAQNDHQGFFRNNSMR